MGYRMTAIADDSALLAEAATAAVHAAGRTRG
jgi:hypothetical protein